MDNHSYDGTSAAFEEALSKSASEIYVLRLYITGSTPKSANPIANIKKICEEHLQGHYDLEVIDIYQHPSLAIGEQIVGVPTLIKKLPLPLRKLIGDMSNAEHILWCLDIQPKK
jgi:circadian clock protein KaiB